MKCYPSIAGISRWSPSEFALRSPLPLIRKRCSSFCVLLRHGFFCIFLHFSAFFCIFLHFSAFFCIYLFLLHFFSLILIIVEKGLQKVSKAEKDMLPYPFASMFCM